MQSTTSLPWILGPLCPGVVVPDSVLSMYQIELNRGLMIIVAGYGHGDTSSNPGPD